MTREEILEYFKDINHAYNDCTRYDTLKRMIDELQEPCDDTISRQAAINIVVCDILSSAIVYGRTEEGMAARKAIVDGLRRLPPVKPAEKVGHCKQCKWWKDSDGAYRRGISAESKCPMNTQKVYEGDGYCYLYEPKMQEVEE